MKFESKLVRYTLTRAKELYEFFVDDIEFFIKIASLAIVGSRQSALDIKKIPWRLSSIDDGTIADRTMFFDIANRLVQKFISIVI